MQEQAFRGIGAVCHKFDQCRGIALGAVYRLEAGALRRFSRLRPDGVKRDIPLARAQRQRARAVCAGCQQGLHALERDRRSVVRTHVHNGRNDRSVAARAQEFCK